jgi:hypothetical protein
MKRHPGRPKKLKQDRSLAVTITMRPILLSFIDAETKRTGKSRSAVFAAMLNGKK